MIAVSASTPLLLRTKLAAKSDSFGRIHWETGRSLPWEYFDMGMYQYPPPSPACLESLRGIKVDEPILVGIRN
jgi:hypothetical protein